MNDGTPIEGDERAFEQADRGADGDRDTIASQPGT